MSLRTATLLCLLPTIALAQDASKVSLVSNPFNELLRDAAEISGARVVGLTAVTDAPVSTSEVTVLSKIPRDWRGESICLSVVSADGLYESSNEYVVAADWEEGIAELPYPSKRPAEVRLIPGELISALVSKGPCGSPSDEAAPTYWGGPEHGALRLLLNTSRAEETFLGFPDHPELGDILCDRAATEARNAFDTVCTLPDSILTEDRIILEVISFKGGEMGIGERFTVRLGGKP